MTQAAVSAEDVRAALADTLKAGYTDDDGKLQVEVYQWPVGTKVTRCVIIGEMLLDFTQTMAKGTDVYMFTVYACVPPDTEDAFQQLDKFMSGNGALVDGGFSLREIIWNSNATGAALGITGCSAAMLRWDGWGGKVNIAGTDCVGSKGHIIVTAPGATIA